MQPSWKTGVPEWRDKKLQVVAAEPPKLEPKIEPEEPPMKTVLTDQEWRKAAVDRLLAAGPLPAGVTITSDIFDNETRYSDDQPRDDNGRWTDGGSEGGSHKFDGPKNDTEHMHRDKNGNWNPERAALHQQVVDKMIAGHTAPTGRKPVAYLLGGGTASGKTTASRYIIGENPNVLRVDPDEIKLAVPEYAGLKETDPDNAAALVHEESSYLTKQVMAQAIGKGLDITYDATTSGNGGPKMASTLAGNNYDVHARFVDVPLNVARARATQRALYSKDPINKGRFVPDAIITGSHQGAAANFQTLKDMPEVSTKQFFDTSGKEPKLVYDRTGMGDEKIHDSARWASYQSKAKGQGD